VINYFKGSFVEILKDTKNKIVLIMEVNQIGYEIQITSKLEEKLSNKKSDYIQVFIHLQTREDSQILYGFINKLEQELFRQLININGIGAQLSITLLNTLGSEKLIKAVCSSNVKMLSESPGVGKKTAERIILELNSKLLKLIEAFEIKVELHSCNSSENTLEDITSSLLLLGYDREGVDRVTVYLKNNQFLSKQINTEELLRTAITWLSDNSH
tara:strand:+ start:4692 stop:5333 length:642 start_codon:yes stop_codon:yes gene_type:complete